jgi:hypothetical protein
VAEHEDVDLVARLRRTGVAITASAAGEVLTSGRRDGRTPGGYAGYLHVSLLARAAEREAAAREVAVREAASREAVASADDVGCDRPCVPVG